MGDKVGRVLGLVVGGREFEFVEGNVEGIGAEGRGVGALGARRDGAVGVAGEAEVGA